MGQVTTNTQVWTPGPDDLNEPDTYLATMAASIENGIGARLSKQETTASLVANLAATQTFVNGTGQVVNNTVTTVGYNNGLTFGAGAVTVKTAGLYLITYNSTAFSSTNTSGGSALISMRRNGVLIGAGLAPLTANGSTAVGVTSGAATALCAVNDTLDLYCVFSGATAGTLTLSAANTAYNMFSVTLLNAT